MLQTAGSYGFKTLVDACDIVYRILPTLKSQQHIMYSPLTIDFSSCNLIPTEHVSEFVAVKGPIVYYVPGGGGVQFLKRFNFGGSVLKCKKCEGVEILRHRIDIICCSC